MTVFSSLTNRLFLAMSLLAVVSIGAATYSATVAVTTQAEDELQRGLKEAGTLMDEYRGMLVERFSREAALIADLPRFKANVELNDAPTVLLVAKDYLDLLGADLLIVKNRDGVVLADVRTPGPHGLLDIVSVPISVGLEHPDFFGTLSVGFALNQRAATRFRALTNSEIAFARGSQVHASTLPESTWAALVPLLGRDGITDSVHIGDDDYIVSTRTLAALEKGEAPGIAVILRSRTERLQFLTTVHKTVMIVAVAAVFAAILASYGIARTVTRPLGAVTAAMRDMAATGDLTRRITLPAGAPWEDEDARLLAETFNTMTDSISRFQREAAQRERLSSLGRLSTVVAHEVRNPLMIIKSTLHGLRRDEVTAAEVRAAVDDIDEEVGRLNRIVSDILDFARPIKFDLAPVDLNALCADAARAVSAEGGSVRVDADPHVPTIVSDAERLRLALVNVLTNASHAVAARPGAPRNGVRLATAVAPDGVTIEIADQGMGIAPDDLPRIFDPFFTTSRTGTGLGLAITRNIIEGLGGTITISSGPGGTTVRIAFPSATRDGAAWPRA
jgi:signal transduction histidine kinase